MNGPFSIADCEFTGGSLRNSMASPRPKGNSSAARSKRRFLASKAWDAMRHET